MRILHCIALGGRGGTGHTAFRLVQLLNEHGHYAKIALWENSVLHQRAKEKNIPYTGDIKMRPKFTPMSFISDVIKLKRLIEEESIEIVHTYRTPDYWRAAVAIQLCRKRPKLVRSRTIVVPIHAHIFNRWLHNRATDLVLAKATLIRDNYQRAKKFDMSRVKLFLDGVDTQTYHPANKSNFLRKKYNIDKNTLLVGTVARLSKIKGFDYLLPAIRASQSLPFHFFIIGFGKLQKEIEAYINKYNLKNVTIIGKVPDIEKYIASLDIYLLTSIGSEGSSRATLEAMASGLPVITTNVGVLPDIVRHEENGFLIPPRSSRAIVQALNQFLQNNALVTAMGKKSRQIVEENFTEKQVIERLENIYKSLL